MRYRRMPIEIESPEQIGYDSIDCNLTESSVSDARLSDIGLELAQLNNLVLCYSHHAGKLELRESVIQGESALTSEDVLITPGAAGALYIVATTLLEKGDRLVVAKPNYATNLETPYAIGAEIVHLPLTFEQSFKVDLELLKKLITPGTRLVSLTTPHNPSGAMMSLAELKEVVRLVEANNTYLLLDETYREMAFGTTLPFAASLSERVIGVSSLSKAFGLPGIRIGWLACREKSLMEKFLAAKEQIFLCNSVVDEELGYRFLQRKSSFLPTVHQRTLANFAILKKWMSAQEYLEWVEPQGGVVCFPRFKSSIKIDMDRFYCVLNDRYKTHVGPGHWFQEDRRNFRIGFSWPSADELAQGLANITAAANAALSNDECV